MIQDYHAGLLDRPTEDDTVTPRTRTNEHRARTPDRGGQASRPAANEVSASGRWAARVGD